MVVQLSNHVAMLRKLISLRLNNWDEITDFRSFAELPHLTTLDLADVINSRLPLRVVHFVFVIE